MTGYKKLLSATLTALLLLPGCVKQSGSNDCPHFLHVSLYSKTICESAKSYPRTNGNLLVCAFDNRGVLAAYDMVTDAVLSADYTSTLRVPGGLYTVSAWAGLDQSVMEVLQPVSGRTTHDDLLFSLRRTATTAGERIAEAFPTDGLSLWQGQGPAVYIDDKGVGTCTEGCSVNILEQTNRMTVIVEGLPDWDQSSAVPSQTRAEDRYRVTIEANNGSMNYDGAVAQDEILTFQPFQATSGEGSEGVLEAYFTLLKLETGHSYYVVITDTQEQKELYRGSLLGALILKNPEVNLRCDHDFTLRFTARDQCECGTYAITEIWVNDWLVHSYGTDF